MNKMIGEKFNRLTIVAPGKIINSRKYWICQCECGIVKEVREDSIKNGHAKSCGCLQKEKAAKRVVEMNTTHGMTHNELFNTWQKMLERCYKTWSKAYDRYGGRGITVDERWHKFENFKNDMYEDYVKHLKEYGKRNTSLDRINNDGNYSKDNCRWATMKEQSNNRRKRRANHDS